MQFRMGKVINNTGLSPTIWRLDEEVHRVQPGPVTGRENEAQGNRQGRGPGSSWPIGSCHHATCSHGAFVCLRKGGCE